MTIVRQATAVSLLNLRSLPERLGSSLVLVVGIAGVVAVLTSVLAMSAGFRRTIGTNARDDRAIVLSHGAESEAVSSLSRSAVTQMTDVPGIRRTVDGRPLTSAEILIAAPVPRKSDGANSYVTLRGIGSLGLDLRPEIKVVDGRLFRSGIREVIVGRSAQAQFKGLEIGNHVLLRGGEWNIVGTFESGMSMHESGMLADVGSVQSAYQTTNFTSMIVQLESPQSLRLFKDGISLDPSLDVEAERETDYVANVSKPLNRLLNLLAYSISGVMAIGALFGALNTIYSAVSSRAREIGTLRAMGFDRAAVVSSVLVEASLLALLGAVIGTAFAFAIFNGRAISTIGGAMLGSQLVYKLTVTWELMLIGVTLSIGVGLVGGLFPAIRAARMPIVAALREL